MTKHSDTDDDIWSKATQKGSTVADDKNETESDVDFDASTQVFLRPESSFSNSREDNFDHAKTQDTNKIDNNDLIGLTRNKAADTVGKSPERDEEQYDVATQDIDHPVRMQIWDEIFIIKNVTEESDSQESYVFNLEPEQNSESATSDFRNNNKFLSQSTQTDPHFNSEEKCFTEIKSCLIKMDNNLEKILDTLQDKKELLLNKPQDDCASSLDSSSSSSKSPRTSSTASSSRSSSSSSVPSSSSSDNERTRPKRRESLQATPLERNGTKHGISALHGRGNQVEDRNSVMSSAGIVSLKDNCAREQLQKVRSVSNLHGKESVDLVFKARKISTLPSRLAPGNFVEETTTVSRRTSINSVGRNLEMEDEEDDMFNNKYLTDLKEGRCLPQTGRESNASRMSELAWRNSLVPPHLKSSYPAEIQFLSPTHFKDDDIKTEHIELDDSLCKLLPDEKPRQKKDFGTTSYKKPGTPTPSKNGGRTSLQGNEIQPLREVNAVPSKKIVNMLTSSENVRWRLKQVHTGKIFDVNETVNFMVGSSQTAQISLNSNKTSRTHACFVVNFERHLLVKDLKSVNGTFVNGTQIAVYVFHRVFPGDIIGFGVPEVDLSRNDSDKETFFTVLYEEPPVQIQTAPQQEALAVESPRVEAPSSGSGPTQEQGTSSSSSNTGGLKRQRDPDTDSFQAEEKSSKIQQQKKRIRIQSHSLTGSPKTFNVFIQREQFAIEGDEMDFVFIKKKPRNDEQVKERNNMAPARYFKLEKAESNDANSGERPWRPW